MMLLIIDIHLNPCSEFDFYLCSHPGLQGTSKPTHYHIYHDDNQMGPDMIQDLTYKLCYLYCRATRSVSVCPPAYYAHLVATRARFHATVVPTSPFTIDAISPTSETGSLDELSGGLAGLQITPCSSTSSLADTQNHLHRRLSSSGNLTLNNSTSSIPGVAAYSMGATGKPKRQKSVMLPLTNTEGSKSFQFNQVRPELAHVMYFM